MCSKRHEGQGQPSGFPENLVIWLGSRLSRWTIKVARNRQLRLPRLIGFQDVVREHHIPNGYVHSRPYFYAFSGGISNHRPPSGLHGGIGRQR